MAPSWCNVVYATGIWVSEWTNTRDWSRSLKRRTHFPDWIRSSTMRLRRMVGRLSMPLCTLNLKLGNLLQYLFIFAIFIHCLFTTKAPWEINLSTFLVKFSAFHPQSFAVQSTLERWNQQQCSGCVIQVWFASLNK